MKSTIFGLLFASLMLAGCGKSDSGGGSNMYYSNLSQTGQSAAKSFSAWYQSATEGSSAYPGVYYLIKSTQSTASNADCEQKWYGWYCKSSSSNSSGSVSACRTTIVSSTKSVKGSNPILAGLYNNTLGTLINASQSGNVYTFMIQKASGYVVTYTIDSQYHSAFQPMQVIDSETSKRTIVTNATSSLPSGVTDSGVCF